MSKFIDTSTANDQVKLSRFLGNLKVPNAVYFFQDGYPRIEDIQKDADAGLSVLTQLESELAQLRKELEEVKEVIAENACFEYVDRMLGGDHVTALRKWKESITAERDRLAAIVKEAGEQEPKWFHCTAPIESREFLNSDEICYIVDAKEKGELSALEDDGYLIEPMFARPPTQEGYVMVHVSVLVNASSSLGAFCSDEGWGQDDMDNMNAVEAELAKYYARLSATPGKD